MAEVAPPANATGVIPVRRVASLLYANVNGETINKGEITDRIWHSFYSKQDIKASLTVKNLGNTDFAVANRLQINGIFGNQIDEIVEPSKIILPETSRTFEFNWHSNSSIGIFHLTLTSQFLDQTITESKLIFIIPVWLIILTPIIILAVIVTVISYIKNKRHNRRRDHAH
jgi:hypothetical protein